MNILGSALLTDLYQLTMLHAYHVHRMKDTAVFELFVRRLPAERNFLVAAGLEQVLAYLEELRFPEEDLAWVRDCGLFPPEFADYLKTLRFTGDVHALPEGTVFFAEEPILRITAPLPEAQLVETVLVNLVHFQSMIASKASRSVLAAEGRTLLDFGLRRSHGRDAGVLAARAAYIAGFTGTATVLAAPLFGIPVFGTMAHSFVQAHDDEFEAFARFAEAYPNGATLLIDTYDTEAAARKVVVLAKRLSHRGIHIGGVRLDSGDLDALARRVRAILDEGGCTQVKIFASGNLEEHRIARLVRSGAPIDGFGVGTSLATSSDAPSLERGLQASGIRGQAAAQAFRIEGDVARSEAGVQALRRCGAHRSRSRCLRFRHEHGHAAARARHEARPANGCPGGSRTGAGTCCARARALAGALAPSRARS